MRRPIAIVLSAAVPLVLVATSSGGTRAGFVDGVWVDGTVHELITGPPPAGAKHPTPLYVIAPISTSHPLHPLAEAKPLGFGAHDHVAVTPDPSAVYHGTCDLTLVVPGSKAKPGSNVDVRRTLTPAGPKPLLSAARVGGAMVTLNAVARIKQARAAGLAKLIDTHTVIACTIKPRR